jgi:AmmeMemoRadiSam system protein A
MNHSPGAPAQLTGEHGAVLLDVAASAIRETLATGRVRLPDPHGFAPALGIPAATFVTLQRDGELLGCIGALEPVRPLVVDVAHNAIAAAFTDPRLPPVTADDYVRMSIKVSVLGPHEQLAANGYAEVVGALRPGTDGVVIEAGRHRATLLPSVWPRVRDAAHFCEVLWHKAGLAAGSWPAGARVSRYTAAELHDPGPRAIG